MKCNDHCLSQCLPNDSQMGLEGDSDFGKRARLNLMALGWWPWCALLRLLVFVHLGACSAAHRQHSESQALHARDFNMKNAKRSYPGGSSQQLKHHEDVLEADAKRQRQQARTEAKYVPPLRHLLEVCVTFWKFAMHK